MDRNGGGDVRNPGQETEIPASGGLPAIVGLYTISASFGVP